MSRPQSCVAQRAEPSQDTAPEDEERQTSGKCYDLAKIIRGLGVTERVLVVSPLKTMLDDVRKEMAKLGVPLAILRGGAVEQQNTLKAWQTGGFKGLLSDPDLPALNLSEASTVVFLSPVLTDTQFVQAAGRVVRQGSHHASVRVIVLAAAQSTETEDAARVDRFRQLSQPGARD